MKPKGLLERIALAESPLVVNWLLNEGETYKYASEQTMRKWHKTAKARIKELEREKRAD